MVAWPFGLEHDSATSSTANSPRWRRTLPGDRDAPAGPGSGPPTDVAFVLPLGDLQRFLRSQRLGASLGSRPLQRDSWVDRPWLRITKAGDPLLRRLLVGAAHDLMPRFLVRSRPRDG